MTQEQIIIEVAHVKDASRIAQMSRDLVEQGLGWGWRTPRVAQHIKSPKHINLAARHARRGLVGFALMGIKAKRGHLVLCAVDPKLRRQGVGKLLLARLLEIGVLMELEAIVLEVRASNEGAQRFYEALGFEQTEHVKGYYQNREDAYRMVKHMEQQVIEGLEPGMTLDQWLGRFNRP